MMRKAVFVLFFALLLLTSLRTTASANSAQLEQQEYPSGPWALGIVVPENSRLTGGGMLSWTNVTSVSSQVTLPNMTYSDYPTLAVESLMASDGSVMQIAAGLYPGNSKWLAYGWFIKDVKAYPSSYDWVLNSSKPAMGAGAPITLSISMSEGRWRYRVEDLSTAEVASGEYPEVPPALKVGDQEVFALESYTTTNLVFAHMGNLTLDALRINGRKLTAGWYGYGSWDARHNPLFTVGGLAPPSYISLQETNGTLVWGYEQWSASAQPQPQILFVTAVACIVAFGGVFLLTAAYLQRRRKP